MERAAPVPPVSGQTPIDSLGAHIEAAAQVDPAQTGRNERKEIFKEALREVINEWLDRELKVVGRWTLRGIGTALFAACVYFILTHTGWTRQ